MLVKLSVKSVSCLNQNGKQKQIKKRIKLCNSSTKLLKINFLKLLLGAKQNIDCRHFVFAQKRTIIIRSPPLKKNPNGIHEVRQKVSTTSCAIFVDI